MQTTSFAPRTQPEREGFQAGKPREGHYLLEHQVRFVTSLQIIVGNCPWLAAPSPRAADRACPLGLSKMFEASKLRLTAGILSRSRLAAASNSELNYFDRSTSPLAGHCHRPKNNGCRSSDACYIAAMNEPKIAARTPYVRLTQPGAFYWCSCGQSKRQPFCDGSHKGSLFSPLKVDVTEAKTVAWCGCKHSKNGAFCDGSHAKLG